MKKRDRDRLADEIAELDRDRRARVSHVDENTLNEPERAFAVLADAKGKRVFRHGWPDFVVYDPATSSAIFVEVKTYHDHVHRSQRTMFPVLEAMGFSVMIWSPEAPDRLVPWRRWVAEHGGRRSGGARGARQYAPRKVDTFDSKLRRS